MPEKSPVKLTSRGEVLQIKSPAEFFAENQNIAGFDNPGKCLYTTIRELVENSLDAAESINTLPEIDISVEEMTKEEFDEIRGVDAHERVDMDLYSSCKKKSKKGDQTKRENEPKQKETAFYKVSCKDNGVVLSGSKYGVRQTRGKFGLGAKMALIWSKKSTGLPITVESAYSTNPHKKPAFVTFCKLDIDIHKNEPRIQQHDKNDNPDGWRGTKISLMIGGNWWSGTTYKSRIVSYLRQLAVITPYAQFELSYRHASQSQRNFTIRYDRRSEQMPAPPKEVKHHPSSVNNLLMQQLLNTCANKSLLNFFTSEFSNIGLSLAKRLLEELQFEPGMKCSELKGKQVHQITQFFHEVSFPPPTGECLSPAGEYNLRLGILKEVQPEMVATTKAPAAVFEGHSFIIEGGVSLGGPKAKEGISIYRFANRIPLLFESGADVATKTATKRINWSQYKIDHKREKVGVFISIVSTKVPFKGTGKEYIGDDIEEIQATVKTCIQQCCRQLMSKLLKRTQLQDQKQRKKLLSKYIPDVSRSLFGVLSAMQERYSGGGRGGSSTATGGSKRGRAANANAITDGVSEQDRRANKKQILEDLRGKKITEKQLHSCLHEAVEKTEELALSAESTRSSSSAAPSQAMHIVPLIMSDRAFHTDITHEHCVLRLLTACMEQ